MSPHRSLTLVEAPCKKSETWNFLSMATLPSLTLITLSIPQRSPSSPRLLRMTSRNGNRSKHQQRIWREHHFHQHWSSAPSLPSKQETRTPQTNLGQTPSHNRGRCQRGSGGRHPPSCGETHSTVLSRLQAIGYRNYVLTGSLISWPMRSTGISICQSLIVRGLSGRPDYCR